MAVSTIEWVSYRKPDGAFVQGYTFNPIIGCAKKSPGCKNCYAENDTPARVARSGGVELWGKGAARKVTSDNNWRQPVRWDRQAVAAKEKRLVFCASQSDWLEDHPAWAEARARLLKLIFETPNLIWLLLSKEPWNFGHLMNDAADYWFHRDENDLGRRINDWRFWNYLPRNVRLGVSIENQEWAERRRASFEALPARVKFVSYEPALGPVNWNGWEFVDQIISGGESGHDARPSHPDWHRATRDWCVANKKAFFFKQWGTWRPFSEMSDAETRTLYYSNRKAKEDEDQSVLDELYGRTCKVEVSAIGYGGQAGMDKAFWIDRFGNDGHAGMQVFKTGKKAAGAILDGREWREMPEVTCG